MKFLYSALTFSLVLAAAAYAQPEHQPPRDHNRPHHHDDRMPPPPEHPASPLHQVLKELQRENPEEFSRLQALRRTNPAAFRNEARMLVRSAVMQKLEASRPDVHQAVAELSPENQEWLFEMMIKSKLFEHGKQQHPEAFKESEREERRQIRQIIRSHKTSDSEDEQTALAAELRDILSGQYDRHLAARQAQLAEMESKLQQAKEALAEGGVEKEAFIEQRLNAMLDHERRQNRRQFNPGTELPTPE